MRVFFVILLLISVQCFSQKNASLNYLGDAKSYDSFRFEQDSSIVIDDLPFHVKFEHKNIQKPKFNYEQGGKIISFYPIGEKVDNDNKATISKKTRSTKILDTKTVSYDNVFGEGIYIENEVQQRWWEKRVKIMSLDCLGGIPEGAEYLEFIFEIKSSFDFKNSNGDLWDKKSDFFFKKGISLTELSRIAPITVRNQDSIVACQGYLYSIGSKTYLMKKIPVSFLKTAKYPIWTDITIEYGSESQFNAGNATNIISIAIPSTNKVVLLYTDGGNSGYFTAIAGSISGTPSWGSELVLVQALVNYVSAVALSSSKVLVTYSTLGWGVNSFILTVTDLTLSFDQQEYNNDETLYYCDFVVIDKISESKAILVASGYLDDTMESPRTILKILTISGNAVSYGNAYALSYSRITVGDIKVISSTKAVVAYNDGAGYSNIVTYGTSSISSVGAQATFKSSNVKSIVLAILGSDKFVVGYIPAASGSDYGYLRVGSVSPTSISYGSESTLGTSYAATYLHMAPFSESTIILGYVDFGYVRTRTASISSTSISLGDTQTPSNYYQIYSLARPSNIAVLGPTSFLLAVRKYYSSSYTSIAIVGTIPVNGKKWNGTTITKWNGTTISKLNGI